ncbi:MAG: PAS domain S-box protein, partial [Terracidiphilus sp.]|nr:PAS domain S-box protein [Terracidiphilus sp.]
MRLAECFFFVTLATFVVRTETLANHLIWIANGVLLAFLLLEPRRRWAAYLIVAFAAQTAGCVLVSRQWQNYMVLTVLNLLEALISAYLLRMRAGVFPHFTNPAYLLRFIAYGVLAGPLTIGAIYALVAVLWMHTAPGAWMLQGIVADGMGVAITTPACMAIFRTRFENILAAKSNCLYVLLLVVATPAIFSQNSAPVTYILYPVLLLILLHMGMGWAAMSTLFVATVSGWYTFRGQGPFAVSTFLGTVEPSIILQIYIMSAIFMLYSASVVLESQEAMERRLRKIVSLHALITENSRDAIILADLKGNRRYITSAAENLGGWMPKDLIRQGYFDLIHPEDRQEAEAKVKGLGSAGDSATMEMRVRKHSGEYVWVESRLLVTREPKTGTPYGILNVVRDISERKQAEELLQNAYHAVEALAITDSLTGLANRRRFDSCLTAEWRRGMRERTPLSLLMIDVDL